MMVETETPAPAADALASQRAELVAIARRFAPAEGPHGTPVRALQLIRADRPGARLPAVYEPGLVFVLQGRKQATLGNEVLSYDPLHYLVVSMTMLPLGQVVEATPERPYLCARLHLDPHEVTGLVLDGAPAVVAPAPAGRALQLARVSPPLLDALLRLLRLLQAPHDAPVLAPLVLREIGWRVLNGELGPRLRAMAGADSHAQRIGRAVELLKRRYAEPVRIDEVAAAAHMSASTLHQHFKQLTSMSPLQFQKQLRLHQARRLMLSEGVDAAVAAHRVGYESPSQFSREYRRLFGAPPRAEIETLRSAARAGA